MDRRTLIGLVVALAPAVSAAGATPRLVASRTGHAPRIDGRLVEREWRNAFSATPFVLLGSGRAAGQRTTAWVLHDAKHLYVGFECDEDSPEKMVRLVSEKDGPVYLDDSVELFVSPRSAPSPYYHFVINADGVMRDEIGQDASWDSTATAATARTATGWSAELAVPVDELGLTSGSAADWRVNFCRDEKPHRETSSWAPMQSGFHEPGRFGWLTDLSIDVLPYARRALLARAREADAELRPIARRASAARPLPTAELVWRDASEALTELGAARRLVGDGVDKAGLAAAEARLVAAEAGLASVLVLAPRMDMSIALRRQGAPTTYAVCAESSMARVRPDRPYAGPPAARVGLSLARNEREGLQLVVVPIEGSLQNVRVGVSALCSRAGGEAPKAVVRRVGTVNVTQPSARSGAEPGRYPDPLLENAGVDIALGSSASWLVTVHSEPGLAAGRYSGIVKIETDRAPMREIPIDVTVWDFTLPRQSALRTSFRLLPSYLWKLHDFPPESVGANRDNERDELLGAYRRNMLEHRVSDTNIAAPTVVVDEGGAVEIDWETFDREMEGWLSTGLNAFNVHWARVPGGWGSVESADAAGLSVSAEILRQTEAHLAEKGWLDLAYIYCIDEPGSAAFGDVRAVFEHVDAHAPRLKRLLTLGYGASRPIRPGHPQYRHLDGSVDIWVPHSDCYEPEFLEMRRRAGDEIWEYVCISAQKPYANMWGIDFPGTDPRVVFWQCYAEEITGFLYWATNYWEKDPWVDPLTYEGGNGDGSLVYPGADGPMDSLRWETVRDGIEDYDYLTLLEALAGEAREMGWGGALQTEARELLDVSRVTRSFVDYTDSAQTIGTHREAVARMIERLEARRPKS